MILPTSNIITSANENQSVSKQLPQNITKIEDGFASTYSLNGTFLTRRPVLSNTEKEEIFNNDTNLYQEQINTLIDNNFTLQQYYQKLKSSSNINYYLIYSLLQEKKKEITPNVPPMDNITQRAIQKNIKIDSQIRDTIPPQDTYGFSPRTRSANWNEVLYDDFSDKDLGDWGQYKSGSYILSASTGVLQIHTYQNNNGMAYVKSLPLDIFTTNSYQYMSYEISEKFRLDSTGFPSNNWVYLMTNSQIMVVATNDQCIGYAYPPGNYQQMYCPVQQGSWYSIQTFYNLDINKYNIYLYDSTSTLLASATGISPRYPTADPYLKIGDDDSSSINYGSISISQVQVYGVVKNKVFYDNFDHGFWYSWKTQMNGAQNMYINSNKDLRIQSSDVDLAYSDPIDYVDTSIYTISLYFQIESSNNHWFRLIDNGEMAVFISGNQLGYYTSDGFEHFFSTLTYSPAPVWYYLQATITSTGNPCTYDIRVNDPQGLSSNPTHAICWAHTLRNWIRIGNGANDYSDGIIKYIKIDGVIASDTPPNGDSDGLSPAFENGQNMQIFGDDFEQLWAGENSWSVYNVYYSGSGSHQWNIGYPSVGPASCADNSQSCYGTSMGANQNYGNYESLNLYSPAIYVAHVPSGKDLIMVFDNWYKFAPGDSGYFDIQYSLSWNNGWITPPGPHLKTYTSNSNGWLYLQSITIPNSQFNGYNYIRLSFDLYSPQSTSTDVGWFIDDVKIFSATQYLNSDSDGDGILDGVEFYIYGSSSLKTDTDEDGIPDLEEVGMAPFNNPRQPGGIGDPSTPDIYIEFDWMSGYTIDTTARDKITLKFSYKGIHLHWLTDSEWNPHNSLTSHQYSTLSDCNNWAYNNNPPNRDVLYTHYYCSVDTRSGDPVWDWNKMVYVWYFGETWIDGPGIVSIYNTGISQVCSSTITWTKGATYMHELGHNLNLGEEGGGNHDDSNVMTQGCQGNNWNFDYTLNDWQHLDFEMGGWLENGNEHT